MRLPVLTLCAAGLLTACLPSSPKGPAPVQGVSVMAFTIDISPGKIESLYLRNDTPRDLMLTSFTLNNCTNLRQECGAYTPNILLPAGKSVAVMRLESANPLLRFHYQYGYQTAFVNPSGGASTSAVSVSSPISIRMNALKDPEAFVPRATGSLGEPECNLPPPKTRPAGVSRLMMNFASTDPMNRRSIDVTLDTEGRPVRYVDSRGNLSIHEGMPGIDTLPPRTSIQVDVQQQVAILVNSGGGKPTEFLRASGPEVMTAAALGFPRATMDRIIEVCGYQSDTP